MLLISYTYRDVSTLNWITHPYCTRIMPSTCEWVGRSMRKLQIERDTNTKVPCMLIFCRYANDWHGWCVARFCYSNRVHAMAERAGATLARICWAQVVAARSRNGLKMCKFVAHTNAFRYCQVRATEKRGTPSMHALCSGAQVVRTTR